MQDQIELTYLVIAHGLNVVRHISDRIGVMYLGKPVEVVETEELFNLPACPSSVALPSAAPTPNPHRKRERIMLTGEVPSSSTPQRLPVSYPLSVCAENLQGGGARPEGAGFPALGRLSFPDHLTQTHR